MTEKDLKEAAGKKLEEAYKLKSLEDGPSEETVAKWIAIADQRRAENRRRKKKILSCAAALALCICIGATCVVKTPNAVAGGSGGTKVEAGMSTKDVYKSEDQIPESIREKFLFFEELPEGYEFAEATFVKAKPFEKVHILYCNEKKEEISINEIRGDAPDSIITSVDSDAVKENWEGLDVYITEYESGLQSIAYVFVYGEVTVSISVPKSAEYSDMKSIIQKAVRE